VLTAIKLFHTVIWALLAGCILALPVLAVLSRFRWATIISIVVLSECAVLAINGGRCPLTDLAARYTDDRASNFDIYLPNWLANHNKTIFGTLFVLNELIVLWCWLKRERLSSANDGAPVTQVVKAGVVYFALVFGAGFVLGAIRTLWVVPRVGTRTAELMEMPIMLVVTILGARWVVLRLAVPPSLSARIGMGCIGLLLLLVAEFRLMLRLRRLTISKYLASRDPVAGTVYYVMFGGVCSYAASGGKRMRSPIRFRGYTETTFRQSPTSSYGETSNNCMLSRAWLPDPPKR
jgi:hypothetical protein